MIHENNIEERIFEYHEGLLDAAQKEELMAYLHEHPEWQRDFAIWAQSRLHPATVETPAFHLGMLKKGTGTWSWGKASVAMAAIFSTMAIWYFWPSNSVNPEADTQIIPVQPDSTAAAKGDGVAVSVVDSVKGIVVTAAPLKEKTTTINNQGEKSSEVMDNMQTQEEPLASPLPDEARTSISSDTSRLHSPALVQEQSEKLEPKIPSKQLLAAKDSVSAKQKDLEVPSKKEKKKIKHKFSLKPTSDIVPTNSNF